MFQSEKSCSLGLNEVYRHWYKQEAGDLGVRRRNPTEESEKAFKRLYNDLHFLYYF
jgi:hypothetical protein